MRNLLVLRGIPSRSGRPVAPLCGVERVGDENGTGVKWARWQGCAWRGRRRESSRVQSSQYRARLSGLAAGVNFNPTLFLLLPSTALLKRRDGCRCSTDWQKRTQQNEACQADCLPYVHFYLDFDLLRHNLLPRSSARRHADALARRLGMSRHQRQQDVRGGCAGQGHAWRDRQVRSNLSRAVDAPDGSFWLDGGALVSLFASVVVTQPDHAPPRSFAT